MTNAVANRAEVLYVAEVTWGTTPASPALKKIRMTGESLNPTFQVAQSNEIRSDRNEQDLIQIGSESGGNVEFELSYESFDDLLEAALCTTWAPNGADSDAEKLVNGTTEKSFTFVKRFLDVTQYFTFPGARINTLDLTIAPGAIITGTFGVMAKDATRGVAAPVGATFPAVGDNTPMNGAGGISLAQIDGAAIPGGLLNFTLKVNNNYRSQKAVGSLGPTAIVQGKFEVTGDIEVYFADGTLWDNMKNMTGWGIEVTATTPATTGEITVEVPNAKFESAEVTAQGLDTDVVMKGTYRGLYDSTTGGALQISKNGPLA